LEENIRMRNAINDVKFPRSILSTYNWIFAVYQIM
jgi:hypothetical protein